MNIYTCTQIGEAHTNHCEDYAVHFPIGKNRLLVAVMDGCTMGTDSYWVATTVGKLLRKIAKGIDYQEFCTQTKLPSPALQKEILRLLFEDLRKLKNDCQMQADEMLCTLNLLLLDTESRQGETIVVGDGLIVWNGNKQSYEQNNLPDYVGYHLHKDFEAWYAQQTQTMSLQNITDISLTTDGIFTFGETDHDSVIDYLCINTEDADKKNMLQKKIQTITTDHTKRPKDDFAIIRCIC